MWILGEPINTEKQGRANILAEVQLAVAGMEMFFQMPHAGVISIEGERATARWSMHEVARFVGGQKGMTILATYDDQLTKGDDGRWRFSERRYTVVNWDDTVPNNGTFKR